MGNSKDGFPLISSACWMLVWLLGVGLLPTESAVAQSERGATAERLRPNTVRIESAQHGFGFIIGEDNGATYIVTARHVLFGAYDSSASASSTVTNVIFYSDQGTRYRAEVLGTHVDDLAVLRVPTPVGFRWVKQSLGGTDSQSRGTKVWFVGRRDEWFIPVDPGTISSDQPSTKFLLEIDGLSVIPGTSGAPLIANSGIVGMIESDAPYDTRALTIDFIKRAVQQWNYPWGIVEGPAVPNPDPGPIPAPQTCSIDVDSDPAGAFLTVGGVARGVTPAHVRLNQGQTYTVSLKMDGYKPHQEQVDCNSGRVDATLEQKLARITIEYTGDMAGCVLTLAMKIGEKSFRPSGSQFALNGVPLGTQPYTVSGQIGCLTAGMCVASGSGSISVQDGGTYLVQWLNVAYGMCRVELNGP